MFSKKYFFSVFISCLIFLFPQRTTYGTSVPAVDSVTVALSSYGASISSLDLIENTTQTIFIHGSASDGDGCPDINAGTPWQATVYRTGVFGAENCTSNNNNCYQLNESTLNLMNCSPSGDLNLDYQIQAQLEYYSDPTDIGSPLANEQWTAFIQAKDILQTTGNMTAGFEISSLLALDVTTSINYGTINLGSESAQQTIVFTNTGNRVLDLDQMSNGNMVCNGAGSLNILAGNVHWSLENLFLYNNGQAITETLSNIDLNLLYRAGGDPPSQKNMYLILFMPVNGIGGVCNNIINFTAKASVS